MQVPDALNSNSLERPSFLELAMPSRVLWITSATQVCPLCIDKMIDTCTRDDARRGIIALQPQTKPVWQD